MANRAIWLLAVLGLCVSCQKFAEGRLIFRDLLALRDQITVEFHEKVVDVNVTGGNRMTVKFINSPLRSRSRAEKQQRADAVAAFVASHYKQPVSTVSIQFATPAGVEESYAGQLPATP
jgi:hypothetical protein